MYDKYFEYDWPEEVISQLLEDYLAYCKHHNLNPEVDSIKEITEDNISHVAYHAEIWNEIENIV